MSLKPQPRPGVPEETARIASKLYRKKGNIYVSIHDVLDGIFRDEDFALLYAEEGRPGVAVWRLALACLVQYMENLTDEQTVNEIASRIDLKYLLEMELTDLPFDKTVLSRFRQRLVQCQQEDSILERILACLEAAGHIKKRGKQRTDATFVLAAVRELTRLECVGETMRHALNVLAVDHPSWLKAKMPVKWADRYGTRFEMSRLPEAKTKQKALAHEIGHDGWQLLSWFTTTPPSDVSVRVTAAIDIVRRVWEQQYDITDDTVRWLERKELPPCAELIESPYDVEAHYASKRN